MKCHWCERETINEPQAELNGDFEIVQISYCDKCKAAEKEAFEMIDQPERSKREDSCKHEWNEQEMRGFNDSIFFCPKCECEMRCSELIGNYERDK